MSSANHAGVHAGATDPGVAPFDALAHRFWDPAGPFRTLHHINGVRLAWVADRAPLAGARVADVGCGGGLFAEGLAGLGASVTAIDLAPAMIEVARTHAAGAGIAVDYRECDVATLLAVGNGTFDVVCCMEMIEHVSDPAALVGELGRLLRPGGTLFVSTINRGPRAFLAAIVAAEYVLDLVPRGTHEYARFVRPAELARWGRAAGLELREIAGLRYDPLARTARIGGAPVVNYLAQLAAPADGA